MPNDHDKNWIRLCGAVDGFHVRYGHWPTRVRLFPVQLSDIRDDLFSPEDYARIIAKVTLVPDRATMIAEDDSGASYNYGTEGFPQASPTPSAREWFGVTPKPDVE